MKKKILISGGGTGGHYYVARAFGELLSKDYEIIYLTTTNKFDAEKIKKDGGKYYSLPSSGFSGGIIKKAKAVTNLLKAIAKVKKIIKNEKIDIALSCGGYLGVALIYGAKRSIKIIHEQNAIPGLATNITSRRADIVLTSFADCKIRKSQFIGNPRGIMIKKDYARPHFLGFYKKIITVFSGSLGAARINDVITELVNLTDKYQFVLVTGERYYQQYKNIKATVISYTDQPGALMQYSDLVISRAGATIISELQALKKKVILIPSPNVTKNHQYFNAIASKATYLLEDELTANGLLKLIDAVLESESYLQDSNKCSDIGQIIDGVRNGRT